MRAAFALALLSSAILLAACGGSSSNGAKTAAPPAPAGLTKAQFIAQADPICAAGKRRAPTLAHVQALVFQVPMPRQEIVRELHRAALVLKGVVDQLSALAPPPGDRAALARFLGQDTAIVGMITKAAGEVGRGDLAAAVKTYTDLAAASVDPLAFAKDYGLKACSSIGS